jgi:hypothetical protein
MSGRRTSLARVLAASGVDVDPLALDPQKEYAFSIAAESGVCHIVARLSSARSSLHYEDARDSRLSPRVRIEIDWLCEADGILFVIDSQEARSPANEDEFTKLRQDLALRGVELNSKPIVFQVNKRDLKSLVPFDAVQASFRVERCAYVESVASKGIGTLEAVAELARLIKLKS